MTLTAYDSANPPNRQTIKAKGGIAGSRYIKRNLPNSFDLGSTERLGWLADGLGLLYNAEQAANDVLVQSPAWWMDYGKYVSDRLQAFGVRTDIGVNVPASADCQVLSADLSKAVNNLAAFAVGVEPFGMVGYGQISVLNLLTVEKISPVGAKHWLTASLGWSGYPNTSAGWAAYMAWPHAGMVQMLGSNVPGTDMNYLLDPLAMGFEWPESSPYYPKEDSVSTFIVHTTDGHYYVVDQDLHSRTTIADGQTVTTLTNTPGYVVPNPMWDDAEIANIPDVDAVPKAVAALTAAVQALSLGTVTPPPVNVTVIPSSYTGTITLTPEVSA